MLGLGFCVRCIQQRWMCFAAMMMATAFLASFTLAQDNTTASETESPTARRERMIAERFVQVLVRRPRPGTALDRVIDYHAQNETIDGFLSELINDADDAGAKAMIAGLIHARRGDSAAAIKALTRAEDLIAGDAAVSYFLGTEFIQVGRLPEAEAAFRRAIDRGPIKTEAADMYTALAQLYARAGRRDESLSVWSELEQQFPGDLKVAGRIAEELALAGNATEARERFESLAQSARSEEDKVRFAVRAAEMLRELDDAQAATTELQTVLDRLRPGSWLYSDVRRRIEDGFTSTGDYAALADYYRQRMKATPEDLSLRTRLGQILVTAGQLANAEKLLQETLGLAPEDNDIRRALVDVLITGGNYESAAKIQRDIVADDPSSTDDAFALARIELSRDQDSDGNNIAIKVRRVAAAEVYAALASEKSGDAVALAQIAGAVRDIEQTDQTIQLYQKAIDADPKSPQYREYLGEYLFELDRRDEAIQTWQSIAEDDRRDRESLVRLAEIFATFDLKEQSIAAWREAAELDLDFASRLKFADVLAGAGEHGQAARVLDEAESIVESPEDSDRLLAARINVYSAAGTLDQMIAAKAEEIDSKTPTVDDWLRLAIMQQAGKQLIEAAESVRKAQQLAPESVDVLTVAAELASRQNRYADAAAGFEQLAKLDRQFAVNHLKRVASLRLRLGQSVAALAAGRQIIEANPASPDSYTFLARTATRCGRDEVAIDALRKSMQVAPRDNSARRMLAGMLAQQFRTDEAIELYWEAIANETAFESKRGLVATMAPLYQRRGEVERLVNRLQTGDATEPSRTRTRRSGASERQSREAGLLISAAWSAVSYHGEAAAQMRELLARFPRDVELLSMAVSTADSADDLEAAVDLQDRLVKLADTPENRNRLAVLQLEAGQITIEQALSRRVTFASDPARIGGMIRSAAFRGDGKTAETICRVALDRDGTQWGVRLYLVQLLLHRYLETNWDLVATTSDNDESGAEDTASEESPTRESMQAEIVQLCQSILDADAAALDPPASRRAARGTTGASSRSNTKAGDTKKGLSSHDWVRPAYDLARAYRLGQYGRYSRSGNSIGIVEVPNAACGRAVAGMVQLMVEMPTEVRSSGDQKMIKAFAKSHLDENHPLPTQEGIADIDDINEIWQNRCIRAGASYIVADAVFGTDTPSSFRTKNPDYGIKRPKLLDIRWRLAELDVQTGLVPMIDWLGWRLGVTNQKEPKEQKPFSKEDLQRLEKLIDRFHATVAKPAPQTRVKHDAILQNEYRLAGLPQAAEFNRAPAEDASLGVLLEAVKWDLKLNQPEDADALVPAIVRAAGEVEPGSTMYRSGVLQSFAGREKSLVAFVQKHADSMIDIAIACQVASGRGKTSATLSTTGTTRTYTYTTSGKYKQIEVRTPLVTSLLPSGLIRDLAYFVAEGGNQNSRTLEMKLKPQAVKHLRHGLDGDRFDPDEKLMRQTILAYHQWWNDNPASCLQSLVDMRRDRPSDVDLAIEEARLRAELGEVKQALGLLADVQPLGSAMLVRKEMASMNLAARIGDSKQAAESAQRLFGLRMDRSTQMGLAAQLDRLGMKDKAKQILNRARRGRSVEASQMISMAQAYLSTGDKTVAAEVAFEALQKINSPRSRQTNNDYYRRQAVQVLTSAGRLEGLIESTKARLDSSPKSMRLRTELADLYTAAGQRDQASKLWEVVEVTSAANPRQMISHAKTLASAKKHKEAVELYLSAFAADPSLVEREVYNLRNVAMQLDDFDFVYDQLCKVDISRVQSHRIDELTNWDYRNRDKLSDARLRFVEHCLASVRDDDAIASALRAIPKEGFERSEKLQSLFRAKVLKPSILTPTASIWRQGSYSSSGTFNGVLPTMMNVLTQPKAGQRLSVIVGQAVKDDAKRPTAELLSWMVAAADQKEIGEDQLKWIDGFSKPKSNCKAAMMATAMMTVTKTVAFTPISHGKPGHGWSRSPRLGL